MGYTVENTTSNFGLQQLFDEPTQIFSNSSLCIDLIYITQPNLVMASGIHSSLHSNCHHHIVYAKIDLKIHYSLPYSREVWRYRDIKT